MTALCLTENDEDQVGNLVIKPYSKYVILRTGSPSLLANSHATNWNRNTRKIKSGSKTIALSFDEQNIGFMVIR